MSHREASAVLFAATVAVLPDVGLVKPTPLQYFVRQLTRETAATS
jgi:hypothetical protein